MFSILTDKPLDQIQLHLTYAYRT